MLLRTNLDYTILRQYLQRPSRPHRIMALLILYIHTIINVIYNTLVVRNSVVDL